MKSTGRGTRKSLILLAQAFIICALLTAPATAASPGRLDPALCPMRTVASGYANAGHAHADHAGRAASGQTLAEHAHSGHEHAALAPAGQEYGGGGESGHARHDAPPAQENDCRCDPYSMSRCFSFAPPALLSSGEAFIRPAQRAFHEPRNDTPLSSLHADNLFRPPRIPAA
ncbi:MAG: hypothetical protein LBC14_02565 [Desulfovibrio sp.]|nr:hypothetical protein [Desulfovibrio sp.]